MVQREGGGGPGAELLQKGVRWVIFFEVADCRCVDFFVYICIIDC